MDEIIKKIIEWGNEKGINNPDKQFNKLAEEMLEAHEAYEQNKLYADIWHKLYYSSEEIGKIENEYNNLKYGSFKHLIEELGDIGVVWILLCNMLDISPRLALELAHEKNKERKGKTINGNFIKEEDL